MNESEAARQSTAAYRAAEPLIAEFVTHDVSGAPRILRHGREGMTRSSLIWLVVLAALMVLIEVVLGWSVLPLSYEPAVAYVWIEVPIYLTAVVVILRDRGDQHPLPSGHDLHPARRGGLSGHADPRRTRVHGHATAMSGTVACKAQGSTRTFTSPRTRP